MRFGHNSYKAIQIGREVIFSYLNLTPFPLSHFGLSLRLNKCKNIDDRIEKVFLQFSNAWNRRKIVRISCFPMCVTTGEVCNAANSKLCLFFYTLSRAPNLKNWNKCSSVTIMKFRTFFWKSVWFIAGDTYVFIGKKKQLWSTNMRWHFTNWTAPCGDRGGLHASLHSMPPLLVCSLLFWFLLYLVDTAIVF